MDTEVFGDLRDGDAGLTVSRDADYVVTKLFGEHFGHGDILPGWVVTSHVECHQLLQQTRTLDDAEAWVALFFQWETQYLSLTKQRAYRKDGLEVPVWAKPGQKWWYTHQRLQSGHQVFQRVIKTKHLFTFLDPAFKTLNVPATTNGIEGATNAHMRLLLLHHRGMTEEHQRRAIEWWLYLPSGRPDFTTILRRHTPQTAAPIRRSQQTESGPGPVLYGTGLDSNEGLWLRSGWGGRG
ncbi:hypothetical protein JSO19_04340 [Leucobacter sp. UCMA 4100]|uniref:hypothetical protein n=1 Tax=Leucobacter sp. UCMA 4100 TaxID=2810534 RepID=UPI0022EA349A|nr:hypothetical protein [Leucobacter sp. UCMA 4100]MDA3146603.1 hypothetical protein [Leucobacter sp. UCMA 4100]